MPSLCFPRLCLGGVIASWATAVFLFINGQKLHVDRHFIAAVVLQLRKAQIGLDFVSSLLKNSCRTLARQLEPAKNT